MKRLSLVAAALLLVAAAFWWLTAHNGSPEGTYTIDLAALRRLAQERPGERPSEVRAQHVATLDFPERAVLAGASWRSVPLAVYAFQVRYADGGSGLIDTGMDEATAKSEGASFFDADAFGRVSAAMDLARFIVVTHEHYDHLGGAAVHPRLAELPLTLTPQQLAVPGNLAPLTFPEAARAKLPKLEYQQGAAIAPGVAVWRAAGHTVGSQLVFVQRADGEEYLFLGDVAWYRENYLQVRERARLATLIMGEDRGQVLAQLAAVKALAEANPKLHVVPGHDPQVYAEAFAAGWLVDRF